MASISLLAFVLSIIAGDGLMTYFDTPIGADFLAFYTGGKFYLNGELEKAYNLTQNMTFPEQFAFQKAIIGGAYQDQNTFVNPPFAVVLFAPFAYLDYIPAYIAWQLFNFGLLVISVQVLRQELPVLKKVPFYKLLTCCFLFYPTLGWFFNAQATPVILLLYCLTFCALRKEQNFKGGFYLGLLAFKPQLAVGIGLFLIFKLRWKSLLGGVISVALSLLVGLLIAPEEMLTYWQISPQLMDLLRLPNYPTWGIHSFFGYSVLLLDAFSQKAGDLLSLLLTAVTLLLLIRLWRRVEWLEDKRLWDIVLAVTITWGLLISPHLFYYDLMLLLLPAAIMVEHLSWIYQRCSLILLWTSLVWAICYLGSYITLGQITLLAHFSLPEVSLQLSTAVIFYWGYQLYRSVMYQKAHS